VSNDEASPISVSNLTSKAENAIFKAFEAIHSLGVLHGDIRAENILVAEGGNAAWIVDFEFAEIINEDDAKKSKLLEETEAVRELLKEIKDRHLFSDI
jgi:serine/threonine protein kinase